MGGLLRHGVEPRNRRKSGHFMVRAESAVSLGARMAALGWTRPSPLGGCLYFPTGRSVVSGWGFSRHLGDSRGGGRGEGLTQRAKGMSRESPCWGERVARGTRICRFSNARPPQRAEASIGVDFLANSYPTWQRPAMTRCKALLVALVASTIVLLGAPADADPETVEDGPTLATPADPPIASVGGPIIFDRDTGWDCPGC